MRKSVSCLALGVGLVAGTLNAQGQTHGPTFVAPVPVPPSGVLVTQPPAARRTVATAPIKRAQTVEVVERTVHQRTASRHVTTRTLVQEDLAAKHATLSLIHI